MAEVKTDCFAYSKKTGCCMALNNTYCKHEEACAFYKTREQHEADMEKYPGYRKGNQGGQGAPVPTMRESGK